ncbi:type II toxin-antitoxin system VapC family toxin [Sphingomonas sp. ac-8]|uniref:type II toxin-antitoxin system VapC family toxin n=1 Tax=Sphingomonas sp. ac-8 TaxID=3242977 RepID=UPI003A80BCEA
MIYVDTNIVLDILEGDADWFDWSVRALEDARNAGRVVTGPVVAAEFGHYLASPDALSHRLEALMIELVDADVEGAWLAGRAYREYRRRGGERSSLLPDFLIGGHAQALGATVLTRDPRRFRSYFPDLPLITPETTHD